MVRNRTVALPRAKSKSVPDVAAVPVSLSNRRQNLWLSRRSSRRSTTWREADVSIATLYRHFPARDELISAVYQQEVTTLIGAADQLLIKREPAAALREWLMLFVDFLDAKHGMAEAMDTLIGGPEPLYSKTPHRLDLPVKALVARGAAAGAFRDDIEPHDLLRALAGVAHLRPSKNWKRSAVRMVDLLLNGLQAKPESL